MHTLPQSPNHSKSRLNFTNSKARRVGLMLIRMACKMIPLTSMIKVNLLLALCNNRGAKTPLRLRIINMSKTDNKNKTMKKTLSNLT